MAFDFPSSPTTGQTYSPSGGPTYTFDGTAWKITAPTPVTSFSAGATGLTPNTATTGGVTLAGTLAVSYGGTGITSFGTGVQTALGNNVTGTGSMVLSASPSLTTPTLGAATATTINKVTITAPATGSTLTVADGKTLTANNTLTFAGTDNTTMTFPASSSTVLTTGNTAAITKGYTVAPNSISTGSFTVDPTLGNYQYVTNNGAYTITAPSADCAVDILVTNGASAGATTFTGFTVGSSTGSPLTTTNGNKFIISVRRINGTSTYSIYALQ